MRYAAVLLVLAGCIESPTAPEVETGPAAVVTVGAEVPGAVNAAGASFTATWYSELRGDVCNRTSGPAVVEVVWSVLQADGTWWTYYGQSYAIGPGACVRVRPDCVFQGFGEVYVLGKGLFHREWRTEPGICY